MATLVIRLNAVVLKYLLTTPLCDRNKMCCTCAR